MKFTKDLENAINRVKTAYNVVKDLYNDNIHYTRECEDSGDIENSKRYYDRALHASTTMSGMVTAIAALFNIEYDKAKEFLNKEECEL